MAILSVASAQSSATGAGESSAGTQSNGGSQAAEAQKPGSFEMPNMGFALNPPLHGGKRNPEYTRYGDVDEVKRVEQEMIGDGVKAYPALAARDSARAFLHHC